MGYEEYISERNGKFSVDRVFNDKKYNFGVFNTYEEALDKIDYLEEEGWPISINKDDDDKVVFDKFGRKLNNIEKNFNKFTVFKFINNEKIIFGEFDSLDEAKQIRDNLIDNAWESMEPNDRSKYGKYIRKSNNKFVVSRIYNGVSHTFGYFNTFEEALSCREELVATNWGDLNIPHEMRCGKYISYNGLMYMISKVLDDGTLNCYGWFNKLDDAKKQRDWLVENNWSKLEVPDDSKKHIHKKGDKFLIYKRLQDDLEYFGTYSSLEEAKTMRNKLIENDWVLEEEKFSEKISAFIYFDGEFYTIEKDEDGQKRIYGVYKNKNQAISDEKLLINNDWDGIYAIPTKEYPYGENIVPFDYIFILEEFNDGIREEIGTYYSFKDAVIARDEIFGKDESKKDRLTFSVKVGKSYKNRGWSIIRDTTYDLIPKLPYEDDCDIIVDGIPTTARLNLLPRIFYTKTNEVVDHLEGLAKTDPNGRIDVQLLLNKKNPFNGSKNEIKSLNAEIKELNNEILNLNHDIDELKEILNYLDDENNVYLKRFNDLNKLVKELNDIDINVNELNGISDSVLRIKVFDIIDLIKSLNEKLEN